MHKPNEIYLSIIKPERFSDKVPIELSNSLGYEGAKQIKDIIWKSFELENGNYAVSIKRGFINKKEYNVMIKLFDNIITLEEFKKLQFKVDKLDII